MVCSKTHGINRVCEIYIFFFVEKTYLTNVIDIGYKDTNEVNQKQIVKIKFS